MESENNSLNFKVSTGLKNVLGSQLITDDEVAVFVLGSDKDVVKDFALGADKIQIDPGDTDPTTLEALLSAADLRIDKLVVNDSGSNSEDRTDTYIYARNSTDTAEDDIVLMVLEDISTDLSVADFSIL